MRKIKQTLLLIATAVGLTFFAHSENFYSHHSEKFYVSSEDVQLENGCIFVWDGSAWIEVDAIYTDTVGLYYERYTIIEPAFDHWDCPACGAYNLLEWSSCYNCGWLW